MSQYECLNQLQEWLDSYLNFEKTPKKNIFWLDTMKFFCSLFEHPENSAPSIHVAGSKGKGSTSAFITSILEEAGYKTGLYTSPHILDFVERIGRAHGPFEEDIYRKAGQELKDKISRLKSSDLPGERPITWFELVTLYGFLCFREAKTDWNVFEVGLGGRLDSTNVITPKVCCIGPIELEHTEFLGDTLEKIAAEKGGIIKEGVPVIIAKQCPKVKEVFKKIAKEKKAPVYFLDEIGEAKIKINKLSKENLSDSTLFNTDNNYINTESLHNNTYSQCFDINTDKKRPLVSMTTALSSRFFNRNLKANLRLLGSFQAQNALMAAVAVKIALPQIDEETIENGLEKAFLPGRFEILNSYPPVILDGAHTVNSLGYTLDTFRSVFQGIKPVVLFACAADKDMKDMAPLFKDFYSSLYLTIPGLTKQSNLSVLEKEFSNNNLPFTGSDDFTAIIKNALEEADKKKEPLLVTGSFYLVSEVKKILLKK